MDGRVHQERPSDVERHSDCQRKDGQAPLAERNGDHEHECGNQADRREDELSGGKILSTARLGAFVLAGKSVHDSGDEKRECGASEERQRTEHVGDARHRTRESAWCDQS